MSDIDTSPINDLHKKNKLIIVKKVFQVTAIVLFIVSLGTVSPHHSNIRLLEDINEIFTIIIGISFFGLVWAWLKNRRTDKKWFGWRWVSFLIILSVLSIGSAVFSEAIIVAREKVATTMDNWAIYSAPESNFSIRFPSNPIHTTQNQNVANGKVRIDSYKSVDYGLKGSGTFDLLVNGT